MNGAINLYWNNKVGVWNWLKGEQCSFWRLLMVANTAKLTLKLLCTSVSSKSITIHFLCMSECLIWGNRYRFWPPLPVSPVACPIVCVWRASIDPPFWLDFERLDVSEVLRCRQQQNRLSHIRRFCGFTFSSMFAETIPELQKLLAVAWFPSHY